MSTRKRQQEDVDKAYEVQSKAAIQVCPMLSLCLTTRRLPGLRRERRERPPLALV